jgi:hypothetical protein
MNRPSIAIATIGAAALAASGALAGDDNARSRPRFGDADAVAAEIDGMRPERHAWREVRWVSCPREALRRARAEDKPIITWVFLGNPADERC